MVLRDSTCGVGAHQCMDNEYGNDKQKTCQGIHGLSCGRHFFRKHFFSLWPDFFRTTPTQASNGLGLGRTVKATHSFYGVLSKTTFPDTGTTRWTPKKSFRPYCILSVPLYASYRQLGHIVRTRLFIAWACIMRYIYMYSPRDARVVKLLDLQFDPNYTFVVYPSNRRLTIFCATRHRGWGGPLA